MKNNGSMILIFLALGLAPFFPEPHIFGKIRWIFGGANDMAIMDWADTAMHGIPLIAGIILSVKNFIK